MIFRKDPKSPRLIEHVPHIRAGETNLGLFKQLFFLSSGAMLLVVYTPEFSLQLEGLYPKVKSVPTFLEDSGFMTEAGGTLSKCKITFLEDSGLLTDVSPRTQCKEGFVCSPTSKGSVQKIRWSKRSRWEKSERKSKSSRRKKWILPPHSRWWQLLQWWFFSSGISTV